MSSNAFASIGVPNSLTRVLSDQGITEPTPIQAVTLPDSLSGRDVLGRGRTGSGKTYAFLLPLVARLQSSDSRRMPKRPRALILAPTRELVGQIEAALKPLADVAGLRTQTIFGGVGQNPQANALARGIDVAIACPGRLEDLVSQGLCDLSAVEITVLDEADHMADLGFLPVVKRILDRTPLNGQRLLFSATLDRGIDVLVKRYLSNPVTHHADSAQSPVSTMDHHVLHVAKDDRLPVLVDLTAAPGRTVVFTRTKHGAKKLAKQLVAQGVPAVDLHGNLSQNARVRNMDAFHSGTVRTLVATDIAARGIHVDDVSLVIHADPPAEHKAYLHRSGRTARAGAAGTVVTLMLDEQQKDVRDLTRAAGIKPKLTRVDSKHPLLTDLAPGERSFVEGAASLVPQVPQQQTGGGKPRSGGAGRGRGRNGQGSTGGRSGQGSTGGRSGQSAPGNRSGGPKSDASRPSRGSQGGRPAFTSESGGASRRGPRRASRPSTSSF
ncbi:DEAD/DEAH box helicase [Yimella sp. cx-573]|nr:DEAD/DEAH box helicase [Yimella sp. cx-573]